MKNSKFVTITFIAAGIIVWFVTRHYIEVWVGYFQLSRRLGADTSDLIRHLLPILLGVALAFGLRSWTRAATFVGNCLDELFRVVFPGPREVRIGTFWDIILVILSGLFFGGLDWCIVNAVKGVIGIKG